MGINKLVTLEEPNSVHSDVYRLIRTNIEYSSVDKVINVINVTSTMANEAKTTTACNLAVMNVNKSKKVLLADFDLRNPSVHKMFNIKNTNGLTDLLLKFLNERENLDINQFAHCVVHQNINAGQLFVLPAGTAVVNPTEILSSKKITELIEFLKTKFDIIIIDSSPSGIISDGIVTSKLADGTVFIVESGKTKIDLAKKTIDQLKTLGVNIIGVVMTKVQYKAKNYGYYGNKQTDKSLSPIRINVD